MRVEKRDNTIEDVSFDKVLRRIRTLCQDTGLGLCLTGVSADEIAQKVCSRIYDGVKTSELDELAAQLCASMITAHPDYGTLAARIIISNHHKNSSPSFSETIAIMYNATDVNGNPNPLIAEDVYQTVQAHKEKLNSIIDYSRDYDFSYFGFKTLERSYLSKVNGKIVERPQHMWMRVALGIHGTDIKEAIETYNAMSQRKFTHATPTLFNAGTSRPGLSSCFLLGMDDSITGIYKTLGDCAMISKTAGGIGIHIHNVRARNSYIRGTNGVSTGIIPMLRVFNETAKYVNQCFRGETIVYTEKGQMYIENIRPGDMVLTIDNTYQPVLEVFKNKVNKDILKIACEWSTAPVYVTNEHQIFTLDNLENLVERSASEFKVGDLVGFPTSKSFSSSAKVIHGMSWVPIMSVETVHFEGSVYDLNVRDNHNYTTDIGLVHNSGRRNGSIAVYLEPWHADIEAFLDLRKNHGNEDERCRDLFTALWIPDAFMKAVESNGDWYTMCPDECPGLCDVYVDAFDELYAKYVAEGKFRKKLKAQQLWFSIIKSQIETGTPYILYKDHVNRKSNQKNLGTIKSSNLCSEIVEYSDHTTYASCNLASLSLPAYVKINTNEDGTIEYDYDFEGLHTAAQMVTRNLNKVIDRTYYPAKETETNNKRHRPLGIGVTGLADVFAMMRYAFDSPEAAKLNVEIFESIYYGCLKASMMIAKRRAQLRDELTDPQTPDDRRTDILKYLSMTEEEEGLTEYIGAYATFKGSPSEQGLLQFDMWGHTPSSRWDWEGLKEDIKRYGLRNSLLTTCMPSASTSQIIGNNESIEPFTSNAYVRETLAGNFYIINKYLVADLIRIGLWDENMKNKILAGVGSIQHIEEIPSDIKSLYKTAWELKQKVLIDHSADRGPFVCQSQSLNLFMEDPDFSRISNALFYGWKRGLKTSCYYLRSRPKAKMSAYTLEADAQKKAETTESKADAIAVCRRENPEACLMCSA